MFEGANKRELDVMLLWPEQRAPSEEESLGKEEWKVLPERCQPVEVSCEVLRSSPRHWKCIWGID